jgi:hypothetical protein
MAKSVAVPPFNDDRLPENSDKAFLLFLPLVPYGWQDFKQPEGPNMHLNSGLWQFKPTEDIAKALAVEVNNSRIFREAFFTFRESEGDLILRGNLTTTLYEAKAFSYGLSFAGPYLWFIGAPAGSIKNSLAFKLRLEDRASQKVVWEKVYATEHDAGVFWVYSIPEDFFFDTMLKGLMPSILSDLEQFVRTQ